MASANQVLEYKCPCCGAGLAFDEQSQKLSCGSCGNQFELDAVKAFSDTTPMEDTFEWDQQSTEELTEEERQAMQVFTCPSCGGELLTDHQTVATFCPYCDNPAIIPGRTSKSLRPDGVIPFIKTQKDAQEAFYQLCKRKPLLPKGFCDQQRLEKITGMYVPFWIYDCHGALNGRYRATRVKVWSDSNYNYRRTDHFLLLRQASADFSGVPMDGSSKMDNAIMESIEPFDYGKMMDFDTAYLSGFLADKYDVEADAGKERIRQRVSTTMDTLISPTFAGYASVVPTAKSSQVAHGTAKYVLLPVWMLISQYQGKTYTFAMNGQTGKLTGTLPICPKKSAAWFCGIAAAAAAISALLMLLL